MNEFVTVLYLTVFIKCSDDELAKVSQRYTDLIQTLTTSASTTVLSVDDHPPLGCAIQTVSARCEVHLLLKVIYALSYLHNDSS